MTVSWTVQALELVLQDAGNTGATLRDRLVKECVGADRGGAIFAWTNATGAKELLDDPAFLAFVAKGSFELVVGTDSITDEAAVDVLVAADAAMPNLTVRGFVHGTGNLFHPKLAWFVKGGQLVLLIGSGNLTMGGLAKNWEAFAVATVTGNPAVKLERDLNAWRQKWAAMLPPVSDPKVRARAAQNRGQERDFKRLAKRLTTKAMDLDPSLDVLVAEVSKSRGGWTQVNFHKSHFQLFFGADLAALPRFIRAREVMSDGRLRSTESARGIKVASQNYRFEFSGPRGRSYPSKPPIGVHIRLGPDDFIYIFREPGQPGYDELNTLLGTRRGQAMRQKRFTLSDVLVAWPSAPLGKVKAASAYSP